MARRFVVVLLLVLAVAGLASAQEAKELLRKAKVGDYAAFKLSGGQVQGTMRQEVTAVTEKNVTIKTTSKTSGFGAFPPSEQTVAITTKYDPAVEAKNRKDLKFVDTGHGEETLSIAGKAYKCEWSSNTTTAMQGGMEIVSESKVWISADAPVYGLVRTETKVFGQTTVIELTDAGRKPK